MEGVRLPLRALLSTKTPAFPAAGHPRGAIMKQILTIAALGIIMFSASSCGESPRFEKCKEAYQAAIKIGQDSKVSYRGYTSQEEAERAFRAYYRTLDAKERQKMQRYAERTIRDRQSQAERRARLNQEADEILSIK